MPRNKPFASAGYRNTSNCFSGFEPDESFIQPRAPRTSRRARSASDAQTRRHRRARKLTVDRNGCPVGTHSGNTGMFHKSKQGAWENTGAPRQSLTMESQQEFEWMPEEYNNPEVSYRDLSISATNKRQTANGFRLGSKPKPELFDPAVRTISVDNSAAPDRRMLDWITPNRVQHAAPFKNCSAPREGRSDRGYIGSHKHFPAPINQYETYEHQLVATLVNDIGVNNGHRPPHRTSSLGIPFKPSNINNPIPSTFERNYTKRTMRLKQR